jgi:hypothetical protein
MAQMTGQIVPYETPILKAGFFTLTEQGELK